MALPSGLRWVPPRRWGGLRVEWRVVAVPPYRIYTVEAGRGTPVVLLHGLSGSSRWWRRNAPALAARHRVLIPDVIGFGRTRAVGRIPSIAEVAAILREWSERLGLERFALVGHSMGGEIAIHLAARHPQHVERLALVAAAGLPRALTPAHLLRFATELAPPRSWGDPRFLPVIVGDALYAGPRSIVRALGNILRDDVRPLLPAIAVPTLLVWGRHDALVPLADGQAMRAAIPAARLAVLAGAAHNPMVDEPDAFNELLLRFLAGEEVGE